MSLNKENNKKEESIETDPIDSIKAGLKSMFGLTSLEQPTQASFVKLGMIAIVCWIIYAIFCAGLFWFPSEREFAKKLIDYENHSSTTIKISELTNFDWDQVCLILPYEDIFQESFKDAELRMLRPALQYRFWVGSEGSWWLVFKMKQAVVKSVRIKSIYMPIYTSKYRSSKTIMKENMKTYSCLGRDAAFLKFNDLHNAIISFGRNK